MGWLHCSDLRHKIAHYSLASRREGSVHPVLAALMPSNADGELQWRNQRNLLLARGRAA
jgi:hypothetical protein